MINRISHQALENKMKFFLKMGIPFKKLSTTERTILHAEGRWGSWMNKESSFLAHELQFIKSVKEYVIKHGTYKKIRNNFKIDGSTKKIKYFYYNRKYKAGDEFTDVIEIDLKNCYWQTAYKLPPTGLFNQEIYERGLKVSKKSRLAAIGSFAKVVSVMEFDGKEEKKLPDQVSEKTEFLWHTICYKIGKIMAKASKTAKNDFLFFWVDAIFVKGEAAKQIIKLFKEYGYDTTTYKCEWLRFEDKKITVKSTEKGKWVTVTTFEIIDRDGKQFKKKIKTKVWKDERIFNIGETLSEKDILKLAEHE